MSDILSIEPATGRVLWKGEESDVDVAVASVAEAWPQWAAKPFSYRIETMRRFVNLLRGQEGVAATLIAREIGKPLWDAKNEVAAVIEAVEHAIAAYSARTGPKRLDGALGARTALRHKPHGVIAVITPYCNPAQIPAGHIVPALIAGNGVVFKPSERAIATASFVTGLLHEAGVPEALLMLVVGGTAAGATLAAHASVNGVIFTGSAQAGIAINRMLAARPDRIAALNMGGNNPMILWDTPDLRTAMMLIAQSAFPAAGQTCTAGRRLIVHDTLADAAVEALCELASRLVIDDPLADPAPYMGPVIDMDTADGLTESFLFLMSNGGQPISHMRRPYPGLPFTTPGIIDVTRVLERPDVELFGPIVQIVRVPDFDAAIVEANATRFGLAAALFGGTEAQYDRFWAASRAGIVNWNKPLGAPGNLPAGGIGLSGNHRPGGSYAADHCAYPVVSAETAQLRAAIGVGLRAIEVVADR